VGERQPLPIGVHHGVERDDLVVNGGRRRASLFVGQVFLLDRVHDGPVPADEAALLPGEGTDSDRFSDPPSTQAVLKRWPWLQRTTVLPGIEYPMRRTIRLLARTIATMTRTRIRTIQKVDTKASEDGVL
jgi:hypothetical protein